MGRLIIGVGAIFLLVLLIIQYSMIVTDIRNNNARTWEIIVGIIPFGPYILMILTGLWYLIALLFGKEGKKKSTKNKS